MQQLQYIKPKSLHEALQYLHEYAGQAKPYAGGTDLMVQLRAGERRLAETRYLIDINGLAELHGFAMKADGTISIGAATSHSAVSQSALLQEHAPFLCAAASSVGSPQIRNMGTVGGNLCNGSPAADTLSPFVALGAEIELHSLRGLRSVPAPDIYIGAGKVKLAPDELAVRIHFSSAAAYNTAFVKLGRRKALAISRMNVAAALLLEEGRIADARIAPGCVFPVPGRVPMAEKLLLGQTPCAHLFFECGKAVAEEMNARTGLRWSTPYKQPVAEALVQRALCAAAGIAEEE
ncbi:MAG: FAD binding domain-containing protein [Christensenellaceae bacterium]|jgi:carbon-monoxide dehydrogenase medium subunit/xanthine dehydrogenase FAD-binding subunit|nr:FAD binding domain-containing protein [Christensenellaceae bacterium]